MQRLRLVRLAYKRLEWAAEYFDPLTTRQVNGPPVPESELNGLMIDPDGLQVIEQALFSGKRSKLKGLQDLRRHVYLAVKEAVHNALKHEEATEITVTVRADANLTITVADNGSGFDPGTIKRSAGNGLANMQSRMQSIGGTLTVKSKGGIQMIFSVPLPGAF